MASLEQILPHTLYRRVNINKHFYDIEDHGLIENGRERTFGEWVEYSRWAEERRLPVVASSLQVRALCHAVRVFAEEGKFSDLVMKEKARLGYIFLQYPLMLSEVIYSSGGDVVVHQVGLKSEERIRGNIFGPDGVISKKPGLYAGFCRSLFGTRKVIEVNRDFKHISGCDSFALRVNAPPENENEKKRVVALCVLNNFRFNLNADGSVDSKRPAFGVRVQKIYRAGF